jgi:RNA polymerase-binding transcription factor DksA
MTIDIKHFQKKLLDEKATVEKDLKQVARINPDNPNDWEAVPEEHDTVQDENTTADSVDEYESNNAIVNTLEPRWRDINEALERIENGTYGKCEACGEEIDSERLEANPASKTCREHMN